MAHTGDVTGSCDQRLLATRREQNLRLALLQTRWVWI
jgi:hypothetical protein